MLTLLSALPLGAIGLCASFMLEPGLELRPVADLAPPAAVSQPLHSLQELLATQPDCQEATDTCRICRIADGKDPVCSNIGVACQPQVWRCTASKPKDAKPAQ